MLDNSRDEGGARSDDNDYDTGGARSDDSDNNEDDEDQHDDVQSTTTTKTQMERTKRVQPTHNKGAERRGEARTSASTQRNTHEEIRRVKSRKSTT